jgi:2-polyprenyl-6-methoxyphenol hydroxylase-like FAD-dependent oxidoreductase
MQNQPQVLIIGAGPSGLMFALAFSHYQIPFKIIDKKEKITAFSKALGMQARTLEILEQLGLAKEMLSQGIPMPKLEFYKGEKPLACVSFASLETRYPLILGIAQSKTESILENALKKKNIFVEWNTELSAIHSYDTHVEVTLRSQKGEIKERYAWIIGCDGIHSLVRESEQVPFLGEKKPELFAVADGKVEGLINREVAHAVIAKNQEGLAMFFPISKEITRVVINRCELEKKETPSLEYINKKIQERVGNHTHLKEISWSSIFNIQYRKATLFFKGRSFFVGDAAHVHSPIGGQGMNTGLQDAYNLAWKLALVIQGRAKISLLDTYHEERSTNAKKLLSMTSKMTRMTLAESFLVRMLRAHLIKFAFNTPWISKKLTFHTSQLGVNYRGMSLTKEYRSCPFSCFGRAFKKGPRAGERVVDVSLDTEEGKIETLYQHLDEGRCCLLLFLTHKKDLKTSQMKELLEISRKVNIPEVKLLVYSYEEIPFIKEQRQLDLILDKQGKLHQRYGALKPCMYLIRPDQYIGMRSSHISYARVRSYLSKIF